MSSEFLHIAVHKDPIKPIAQTSGTSTIKSEGASPPETEIKKIPGRADVQPEPLKLPENETEGEELFLGYKHNRAIVLGDSFATEDGVTYEATGLLGIYQAQAEERLRLLQEKAGISPTGESSQETPAAQTPAGQNGEKGKRNIFGRAKDRVAHLLESPDPAEIAVRDFFREQKDRPKREDYEAIAALSRKVNLAIMIHPVTQPIDKAGFSPRELTQIMDDPKYNGARSLDELHTVLTSDIAVRFPGFKVYAQIVDQAKNQQAIAVNENDRIYAEIATTEETLREFTALREFLNATYDGFIPDQQSLSVIQRQIKEDGKTPGSEDLKVSRDILVHSALPLSRMQLESSPPMLRQIAQKIGEGAIGLNSISEMPPDRKAMASIAWVLAGKRCNISLPIEIVSQEKLSKRKNVEKQHATTLDPSKLTSEQVVQLNTEQQIDLINKGEISSDQLRNIPYTQIQIIAPRIAPQHIALFPLENRAYLIRDGILTVRQVAHMIVPEVPEVEQTEFTDHVISLTRPEEAFDMNNPDEMTRLGRQILDQLDSAEYDREEIYKIVAEQARQAALEIESMPFMDENFNSDTHYDVLVRMAANNSEPNHDKANSVLRRFFLIRNCFQYLTNKEK